MVASEHEQAAVGLPASVVETESTSGPFKLRELTARELMELPEPDDASMLAGPLVIRGARTIIVGDTGHGKTTLSMQLAAAILTGAEVIGFKGAGVRPVIVLDLEQGVRSIKRVLLETRLDGREDLIYIPVPDGLALDSDDEHRSELARVVENYRPALLVLDPFYKAHRGDANEERAVVDLMRYLDELRNRFGFALLLPAHPRKDPTSGGSRKLTLHDVSGSGAVVRGAEVVLAIERLSHGYARLRILKDRDGDLPVGDAWPLIFDREHGFRLDPKEERTAEELEQRILADRGDWRTVKEWASELGIREGRARTLLDQLVEAGKVKDTIGPPGRSPRAHCYRAAPALQAQSGAVTLSLVGAATALTAPTSIGDVERGRSGGTAFESGAIDDEELNWR